MNKQSWIEKRCLRRATLTHKINNRLRESAIALIHHVSQNAIAQNQCILPSAIAFFSSQV
ncbi:hypothetical protein [Nostoc sp.]|uniref:hypothetical protein n=1 Tax=Nostoc sp. TaxID=1180 RepID=UPI002FF51D5B